MKQKRGTKEKLKKPLCPILQGMALYMKYSATNLITTNMVTQLRGHIGCFRIYMRANRNG